MAPLRTLRHLQTKNNQPGIPRQTQSPPPAFPRLAVDHKCGLMKSLSLFSGIGGFDEGFRRAGIECDSVCEIDKSAQNILRRHFPEAKLYDDVKKVGIQTHGRKSIDLICGGFPCQDVSIAGKRAGLAGERSGLWHEFARIIDELEPGWVVIENVPGLLSSNNGKDFAVIIHWLANRGYGTAWRILDSQYFGIPQRRRRVFIVASFGSGRAAQVLFESESSSRHFEKSTEEREDDPRILAFEPGNLSRRVGSNPNPNTFPTLGAEKQGDTFPHIAVNNQTPSREIAETLTNYSWKGLGGGSTARSTPNLIMENLSNPLARGRRQDLDNESYIIAFDANQNLRDVSHNIAPTLTHNGDGKKAHNAYQKLSVMAHDQKNSKIAKTLMRGYKNRNNPTEDEFIVTGTLSPGAHPGGFNGQDINSNLFHQNKTGIRRLMPVECERLQGFPDGWTDGQSDSTRYRQLGNAVSVPPAEWLGKRIVRFHNQ